jgi:hypothetical protein
VAVLKLQRFSLDIGIRCKIFIQLTPLSILIFIIVFFSSTERNCTIFEKTFKTSIHFVGYRSNHIFACSQADTFDLANLNLFFEQIFLVEEENEACVLEPVIFENRFEQSKTLLHPIGSFVLGQNLQKNIIIFQQMFLLD